MSNRSRPESQTSTKSTREMSASQKFATTATVFASLVGANAVANADLVVVDDQPFEAFGSVGWDIDGDGGQEFLFRSRTSFATTYSNANIETFLFMSSVNQAGAALNGNLVVPQGLGNEMVALNDGFEINSILPANYQFGNASGFASRIVWGRLFQRMGAYGGTPVYEQTTYLGNNLEFDTNTIGFQFDISGATHYGWAEMDIDNQLIVNITRWAYESTPGKSVAVGAIPEPNSLALLGLGAGGLMLTRRRQGAVEQ